MKILCTFPGRYGDLLWALPSIRALAYRLETAVDLCIASEFASIVPLLAQQWYLGTVWSDPAWPVYATCPMTPRVPPGNPGEGYDRVVHLGYTRWPQFALPYETLWTLTQETPDLAAFSEAALRLEDPWITTSGAPYPKLDYVGAFTEDYFELKFGLWQLLRTYGKARMSLSQGRWISEGGHGGSTWEQAVLALRAADVCLADNSALHVLACAVGTPVVMVEPAEARWQAIFYPFGMNGPRVTVVKGGDGKPTWDARYVNMALNQCLAGEVACG